MPTVLVHSSRRPTNDTYHKDVPTDGGLPQIIQTPSGLALVELQGTFQTDAAADEEDANDDTDAEEDLGTLTFDVSEQKASKPRLELQIGDHQRMTGTIQKLPRPLAVVRKMDRPSDAGLEQMEVVEVVKYKVVFTGRPEPVGVQLCDGAPQGDDSKAMGQDGVING